MLSQRKVNNGLINYLTKFGYSDEIQNSLKLRKEVVNFFQKIESGISFSLENLKQISGVLSAPIKQEKTKVSGPYVNIHLNTKSYSNAVSINPLWQKGVSSVSKVLI